MRFWTYQGQTKYGIMSDLVWYKATFVESILSIDIYKVPSKTLKNLWLKLPSSKKEKLTGKKLFSGRMILGKVWNVQWHTKNSGQLDKGREWSVSSNFLKLETASHRVDHITWHVLHLKFCSLDHKLLKAGKCLSNKSTDL